MPRRLRISSGGIAYHVLNRAVGRGWLFDKDGDFEAMERVLEQVHQRLPIRILSYCLMSNHWHLALWPKEDGQLSDFMRLLTVTHTQRWHAHHHTAGTGPLYQGRFKSFPIQRDEHLLNVCRYIERNPVRANLVQSARDWRWSSLAHRMGAQPPRWLLPIDRWPVDAPANWENWVNRLETPAELEAIRLSVKRGRPYGAESWQKRTANLLALQSTLRPRGRQRIHPIKDSRPLLTPIKDSRPLLTPSLSKGDEGILGMRPVGCQGEIDICSAFVDAGDAVWGRVVQDRRSGVFVGVL